MESWEVVSNRSKCATSGRGGLATRDIKKGTVVLTEEAYAFCTQEVYKEVCCNYCCQMCVGGVVLALSAEDMYRYCSEACITKDHVFHQHELSALARIKEKGAGGRSDVEPMKLIVRVAANRKVEPQQAAGGPATAVENGKANRFYNLLALEAAHSMKDEETLKGVARAAARLSIVCRLGNLVLSADEAQHLLLAVQCNAHQILSATGRPIALGLFPLTSMLNHSCHPNCAHSFLLQPGQPPRLVMRAIHDISSGEELVYNYVPLYSSTASRQESLQHCYSFTCCCERCEANDDASLDVPAPNEAVRRVFEAIAADTLTITEARDADVVQVQKDEAELIVLLNRLLENVKEAVKLGAPVSHRTCFLAYIGLLRADPSCWPREHLAEVIVLAVAAAGCINRYCLGGRYDGSSYVKETCEIYQTIDGLLSRFLDAGAKEEQAEAAGETVFDDKRVMPPGKVRIGDLIQCIQCAKIPVCLLEMAGHAFTDGTGEVEAPLPLDAQRAASTLREVLSVLSARMLRDIL